MHPSVFALTLIPPLIGCGSKPNLWEGPILNLPEAKHAFALPVRHVSWVGDMAGDALDAKINQHCATPQTTLPQALLAPAVVTITDSEVLWRGEKVISLTAGRIAETDRRGLLIQGLSDKILPIIHATNDSRAHCIGDGKSSFTALLVIDANIPVQTVNSVFYTLAQAEVSEFAYLVSSQNATTTPRPAKPIGGANGRGTLTTSSTDAHWVKEGSEPKTWPISSKWPQNLGEETPPSVFLAESTTQRFGQLAEVQDQLAGAGVFCVSTAHDPSSEPTAENTKPMGVSTKLQFDPTATVPIHLISLPVFGPPGKHTTSNRSDGARCQGLAIKIAPRKAITGGIEDAFKSGSGLGGIRDIPMGADKEQTIRDSLSGSE